MYSRTVYNQELVMMLSLITTGLKPIFCYDFESFGLQIFPFFSLEQNCRLSMIFNLWIFQHPKLPSLKLWKVWLSGAKIRKLRGGWLLDGAVRTQCGFKLMMASSWSTSFKAAYQSRHIEEFNVKQVKRGLEMCSFERCAHLTHTCF